MSTGQDAENLSRPMSPKRKSEWPKVLRSGQSFVICHIKIWLGDIEIQTNQPALL